MLVLTRKPGEDIFVNEEIRIVVKEIKGKQVRIGIEAPPSVAVYRGEIYRTIQDENLRATSVSLDEARGAAESIRRLLKDLKKTK